MNQVTIIGRVGQTPELKTLKNTTLTNLSVATSEYNDQTEWHRITVFGKQAEVAAKYLDKGSEVAITGRLQTREYTDKAGVKKYSTEIITERLELIGGKAKSQDTKPSPKRKTKQAPPVLDNEDDTDDGLPF